MKTQERQKIRNEKLYSENGIVVYSCSTKKFPDAKCVLDESSVSLIEASGFTGTISPHMATSHKNPGAVIKISGRNVKLHRFLTQYKWDVVDHINRNPMDNRMCNLRESNHSQNALNVERNDNCGICYDKNRNKWAAYITRDGVRKNLGRYETKLEAKDARLHAEKQYEENTTR